MANRWGKSGDSDRLYFLGLESHWGQLTVKFKRRLLLERKAMTNLDILKNRDITLLTKVQIVKAMVFPVVMCRSDSYTALKNWCFWTVVLAETLESSLDWKEIKPVNPKGNQRWIFLGRTDAEAPVLWPPNEKSQLIGKDPDAGKDWEQKEKGMTEVEVVGWHHWLNGREFEQTLGDGGGQGSLAGCSLAGCSLWGHKELDTMRDLTNNNRPERTR